MKLKCNRCGHIEKIDIRFFVRLIGAGAVGTGYWAWVTYLFAGTGCAMLICIAIMAGGVALSTYSNEIAKWASKKVRCRECGDSDWKPIETESNLWSKLKKAKTLFGTDFFKGLALVSILFVGLVLRLLAVMFVLVLVIGFLMLTWPILIIGFAVTIGYFYFIRKYKK